MPIESGCDEMNLLRKRAILHKNGAVELVGYSVREVIEYIHRLPVPQPLTRETRLKERAQQRDRAHSVEFDELSAKYGHPDDPNWRGDRK